MKTLKSKRVPLAVLGGAILLIVLLGPLLQASLVRPLSVAVWAVARVFLSVDQAVYWTLLILAAVALSIRVIPGQKDAYIHRYQVQSNGNKPVNRVEYWRSVIQPADGRPGEPESLRRGLVSLLVASIAAGEGKSTAEVEAALRTGQLEPPERIAALLRGSRSTRPGLAERAWGRVRMVLPEPLRSRGDARFSPSVRLAADILSTIETYLENPYEHD